MRPPPKHDPRGRRPRANTHLSMIPFMRMALFQSFRVDLPARCTNSFGLITCSSYCGGNQSGTAAVTPQDSPLLPDRWPEPSQ